MSFGREAITEASTSHFRLPMGCTTLISSQSGFLDLFRADVWPKKKVVLLIDDFNELCNATTYIRNECLRTFSEIRNNNTTYAICSVIAAGTFGIVNLHPPNSAISPFNVVNHIWN